MFNQCFQDDVRTINDVFNARFSQENSTLLGQALRSIADHTGASNIFLLSSRADSDDRVVMAHVCGEEGNTAGVTHVLNALKKDVYDRLGTPDGPDRFFWDAEDGDATSLISRLDISTESSFFLIMSFDDQKDGEAMVAVEQRMEDFLPLLQLHLRTSDRLDAVSRNLDGVLGVLNNSDVAIMLFNADGRLVLSNKSARTITDAQDGMRMGARAPTPVSLKSAARFQIALEHAIAENARTLQASRGRCSTVLKIPREKGRRAFVATLVPAEETAKGGGDVAVTLYLFDPSLDHLDFLEAVCELYDLSKVEARLARHLAEGLTVSEAALAMRIKDPTARTYLKQIFIKTGTHRQADLVRLLIFSTGRIAARTAPEAFL